MATKATKSSKKKKEQHQADYYPLVRNIPLGFSSGNFAGDTIVDTARCLSIANRRLYRFGNKYQVKLDMDVGHSINVDVEFDVYALVNNWDIQRAYALAKDTYDKAMATERAMLGKSGTARWEDFRIDHGVTGAAYANPIFNDRATLTGVAQTIGEFQNSQVDQGGVLTQFTWGNGAPNLLSVIAEWDLAGQTDSTPASHSGADAPYSGVNSDDSSGIERQAMIENGNLPPYNQNTPGQVWIKVGTLYYRPDASGGAVSAGMTRTSTGYFDAPCGLICLKSVGPANLGNGAIRLTVKPGSYKGVTAHAMCQPPEDE